MKESKKKGKKAEESESDDDDMEAMELNELKGSREKRVYHRESYAMKMVRLGNKFYYTGTNKKRMRLVLVVDLICCRI